METLTLSAQEMNDLIRDAFQLLAVYGFNVLSGMGILMLGFWVSGKASRTARLLFQKIPVANPTLVPVIVSLVRYGVAILALIIALGQFGIQTTSIIAILGAAGLAVGLALQGTLSNVAAGVMLLILRPFETGDWVEISGVSGIVAEIGLFTTHINSFDNRFISVPNSTIWSSVIVNHAKHRVRRLDVDIGIAYDTDLDVAESALLSLTNDSRVFSDPAPRFIVVSYDDSAITVRLRLYTGYDDLFELHWDLLRRLKPTFEAHNIEIPFPQQVVHMRRQSDQS